MTVCASLFLLFILSILTTSFTLFQLNDGMKKWIENIENSTEIGLIRMASLSDKKTLITFGSLFVLIGMTLFAVSLASKNYVSAETYRNLSISWVVCFYCGGSIGAWSHKRKEIFEKFLVDTKQQFIKFTKYFLVFSVILAMLFIVLINLTTYPLSSNLLKPMAYLIPIAFVVLILAIFLGNSLSLGLIFGPALIALIYLRITIFIARTSLKLGKKSFMNLLTLYFIVGTLYISLLTFPALKTMTGISAICQ
ncbi:hypothetical protein GN109_15525 [Collimonas pratensis]|uniref:hypothetical protein n=1 Tax=Collimonas pratensis TaxID=279113 RepID=UPI00143DD845|nr:hypothetical protein [Collimonas pratensis]NKI70833.1 hypothetical protein [Collimonas pratensis]